MVFFDLGLTGNIASGKSTVASIWEGYGAYLIDADDLARRAVEPGSPGLEAVVERFGREVLTPGGELDRAALRRLVFSDPEARAQLEGIIHPEVGRLREEEEARAQELGAEVVVNDIPLLFEVGLEDRFDLVVLVDAPEGERLRRLIEGRGLPEEEARAMITAQMPAEEKRERADILIDNSGTLEELEARTREVWEEIERLAREMHRGGMR